MFSSSPSLLTAESPSLYIDLILRGSCFPTDIFLDSQLIENFLCPIDFAVCRDPVIDPCGHTFGKICLTACLSNSNKCPMTNKNYSFLKKFAPNYQVKNFLNGLKIKCLNYRTNCQWQGRLEELERHLAHDCVDIKEDCPIEGCQEKIARGELLEHIENSCKFVKMKCLFESQGCQEMMNSKDFPYHLVNHHYEEIFQSVKKFDFINREKELYEKKYNELLTAFLLADHGRKALIKDLKEENERLISCLLAQRGEKIQGNGNEKNEKKEKSSTEKKSFVGIKRGFPGKKQQPLKKKIKGEEELALGGKNLKK